MILGDEEIRGLLKSKQLKISPLRENQIESASVKLSVDEPTLLRPMEFQTLWTMEYLEMPMWLVGVAHLLPKWAKMGLVMPTLVVEPGYTGYVTLPLRNVSREPVTVQGDVVRLMFMFARGVKI